MLCVALTVNGAHWKFCVVLKVRRLSMQAHFKTNVS